jgi:hypothetical protein
MAVSSPWQGGDGTRAGRADSTARSLGDRLVSGHVRPVGVPAVAAARADSSASRHQAGGTKGQTLTTATAGDRMAAAARVDRSQTRHEAGVKPGQANATTTAPDHRSVSSSRRRHSPLPTQRLPRRLRGLPTRRVAMGTGLALRIRSSRSRPRVTGNRGRNPWGRTGGRGPAEPRTAKDSRRQQTSRSANGSQRSPGTRNRWSALSHMRGHWRVRHCSALFKAALGRR